MVITVLLSHGKGVSLVNEPHSRLPSRAPMDRDAHLQSFLHILLDPPLHIPLTEFPQREMLHFWSPSSTISQSKWTPPPPGSPTPISRAFFYTSPDNSPVL